MKKNEIDLNLIASSGEEFSFLASEVQKLNELDELLINDENNKASFFIRPIDGPHYEIEFNYSLKCERQCSRCGQDFAKVVTETHKEYLSTSLSEGEEQGFHLVEDSKHWKWAEFLRQTLELQAPYQELCTSDCKPEDVRVILEGEKTKINSPFEKLKNLKTKK